MTNNDNNNDKLINIKIKDLRKSEENNLKSELIYDLNLKRKVTIIVGESGAGKSFLAELINDSLDLENSVEINCERSLYAPDHIDSVESFKNLYEGSVVVIDEQTRYGVKNKSIFIKQDVLSQLLDSNIYFILITRELKRIKALYSPKEVYEIERVGGNINVLKQKFDFSKIRQKGFDKAVCEDIGDGLKFWNKFISTETANGSGNFHKKDNIEKNNNKLHFIDLANYPHFEIMFEYATGGKYNIGIADIECFEWVILKGSMFDKYREKIENIQLANSSKFKTLEKFYKNTLNEISNAANDYDYDDTTDGKHNCILDDCSGCSLKDNCLIYYDKDDKCDDMIHNAGLGYLLENKYRRAMLSEVDSINTNQLDTNFGSPTDTNLNNLEF